MKMLRTTFFDKQRICFQQIYISCNVIPVWNRLVIEEKSNLVHICLKKSVLLEANQ